MTSHVSRIVIPCCLAILAGGLLPATARARDDVDPERVYERCLDRITDLAERCKARNIGVVKECLPIVDRLLEAGRVERARHVAARCINAIETNTDDCVAEVREACRRCIDLLLDLDAPRLARRLATDCDRVTAALRQNEARAVNAIKSAF